MNLLNLRQDFPVLQKNPGLIYLDSAATSLKPRCVIEAMDAYYNEFTANTGRGSHRLSRAATEKFEKAREEAAGFVGAKESELIFTKNVTESVNLAAVSLERMGHFKGGDEVVVGFFEHHANLIPWQQLCERTGGKLKVVKLNPDFTLDMEDLRRKVTKKTKMVSMAHVANTVASIQPVKEIAGIAHDSGALCFIDGAQAVPHLEVDVKRIGADFYGFSSHKMLGPTGIGALYAKEELLGKMPPYNYGGGIIKSVSFERTEFSGGRAKFEAGTQPIAEALGLAEACRYLKKLGPGNVHDHEKKLTARALDAMGSIEGLGMYCPNDPDRQAGVILFDVKGIDPLDFGVALDESRNIAVRTGFMCAEPVVRSINPKGLVRASFYLYNTMDEIRILGEQAMAIRRSFG
ncbi:MAG: aminotransferase class V-fold PLP-dependent enzyme [Candidatus Diapherotrites archaeon]|uniref:cysteine desulfurase n=1 Tax=Candidatus Iainarchaeum sp. TaxID=3101447 RepID=A0A8T3YNK1_9ARCH|nr:aminotransferase class V-fold PLP-dependent enzyme [Candidatus Diapherotrites archaeon]